ncbi:Kelch-type beta propeller, partial [Arabidopsis suecica]
MDTAKVETQQGTKKTKLTAQTPLSMSISSLPDEIVLSFLARISKSYYRSLSLVSKSFYALLSSTDIYAARSHIGATEPRLYVCLWLLNKHRWFTLLNPDQTLITNGVRLSSSNPPARLNSTTVAVGSEIYQIGGTVNGKRSKAVGVLDCRSHTWRRAPSMRVSRVSAKSCFLDGNIYVIGGCRKSEEESMNWGEVFDLKTQTWNPLPSPSDNYAVDSNHKVAVFGERLYVITKLNNYAYDPNEGRWLPDVGSVDLQPITGPWCGGIEKVMEPITGRPWCVIGNVMFTDECRKYRWYSSSHGAWLRVEGLHDLYGLNDLYEKRGFRYYRTIKLVNYGGKLLIIWHNWIRSIHSEERTIWCAVIRLEERKTYFGPWICGEVESCNVVVPSVPKSYKLSSCQFAMDAKVEPPQKKKITISPSPPSFSSLPDELILHCLARISKSYYRSLSLVSKSFYSLLTSPDIYAFRSQIGTTEPCLYICLKSPTCRHSWITLDQTLITNGGEIKDELSLEMVKLPSSHSPTRLNSTTVVAGSEIYQIGGM